MIALMGRFLVKLDRNCGQALCPFNPLRFAGRRASWKAAVRVQRSKQFVILGNNAFRTESIQTKECRIHRNGGKLAWIVARQGNELNHVANLTIESAADSIQHFREALTGGDRLKKLFFRAQYILDFAIRITRQHAFLRPAADTRIRFIHICLPFCRPCSFHSRIQETRDSDLAVAIKNCDRPGQFLSACLSSHRGPCPPRITGFRWYRRPPGNWPLLR